MSRRRMWIILGLVAVLLLAAAGDALAFGGLPLPSEIAETTWTLQSYSSDGSDVALPAAKQPVFVTFQRLGHDFSGFGGCNAYFGKFSSLWPGHITLSNLGQTVVACLANGVGTFELKFLTDLLTVESYRTSNTGLVLTGDSGQVEMSFTAGSA